MAEENEIEFWTVIRFLYVFVFSKSICFLTRYYPFSELWQNKVFHYRNRFLSDVDEILTIAGYETIKFDIDQYYVHLHFLNKKSVITNKIFSFKQIIKILEEKFNTTSNIYIHPKEIKNQYILQIPTTFIFPV